ncbi:sugar-transfer associated ATP-grasp domain-containing protein [Mangrovibacterium lignilyticum]|uniref:sugar-transfer associated ATP-grasp domain-containing protein n=1 Tax=Mangrovibacterium lignilyticum TaxID=2668052 RepID=UPI0013D6CE27|nr:sugar-transfer associated ATP-grasp domain-containing protein [Mangrovibacterium lignilyticum]
MEKQKGKTKQSIIGQCDKYAKERFGSKIYAPWLYAYSAIAGEFRDGWIPDNYFGRYMVPMLQGDYGDVSFLKPLTRNLFQSNLFPDIGAYVNGIWLDSKLEVIPEAKVAEYLFRRSDKIVYKADNEPFQGLGVYFLKKSTFDMKKIKVAGNGVFQEYIQQHPFFEEIMPGSVATIRITTVIDLFGNVSVRSSILRVGRTAESHVLAKTEIRITSDLISGELSPVVYLPNFQTTDRHPDTSYMFSGKRLPFFDKCIDAVCSLHRLFPQSRCIGWDVIVDKNGDVKIMEWNGKGNGVKLAEAIQGPCFANLDWDKLHLREKEPNLCY